MLTSHDGVRGERETSGNGQETSFLRRWDCAYQGKGQAGDERERKTIKGGDRVGREELENEKPGGEKASTY